MPTLRLYPNGLTMGVKGGNPNPPKRGVVKGWTAGAVRRHTRWLYSVDAPALDGVGYALTLTMRDTPATSDDFHRLRNRWEVAARRLPGFLRLHWVVEWQRRGTPHLHVAVYYREPSGMHLDKLMGAWLSGASEYGARVSGQHWNEITGPLGWLQYLSKHAARGVRHYQRNGHPKGWDKTGRLWGKSSGWPLLEPVELTISREDFHRYRRLVRSWRVADARASGDARRVALARRMLACPDPRLSAVRGVSDWVPESVSLTLLGLLGTSADSSSRDSAPSESRSPSLGAEVAIG